MASSVNESKVEFDSNNVTLLNEWNVYCNKLATITLLQSRNKDYKWTISYSPFVFVSIDTFCIQSFQFIALNAYCTLTTLCSTFITISSNEVRNNYITTLPGKEVAF